MQACIANQQVAMKNFKIRGLVKVRQTEGRCWCIYSHITLHEGKPLFSLILLHTEAQISHRHCMYEKRVDQNNKLKASRTYCNFSEQTSNACEDVQAMHSVPCYISVTSMLKCVYTCFPFYQVLQRSIHPLKSLQHASGVIHISTSQISQQISISTDQC